MLVLALLQVGSHYLESELAPEAYAVDPALVTQCLGLELSSKGALEPASAASMWVRLLGCSLLELGELPGGWALDSQESSQMMEPKEIAMAQAVEPLVALALYELAQEKGSELQGPRLELPLASLVLEQKPSSQHHCSWKVDQKSRHNHCVGIQ